MRVKLLITGLVAAACLSTATANEAQRVFVGEISDTQCAFNVHSRDGSHTEMIRTNTMGSTAEECARACAKRSGKFVLVDVANKKIYHLDDQVAAEKFAAKRVRIVGSLEKQTNQIHVTEIKQSVE